MLGENNYYTPNIEEFCIGFDYEAYVRGSNGSESWNWQKYTCSTEQVIQFTNIIKRYNSSDDISNVFRAKYLDGDDIMSFGFEIANDEGNTYKSLKRLRGLGSGDDRTLFIQHDVFKAHNGETCINTWVWWQENRGTEITVFEGKLKNKSEFRKLLKQIYADKITTEQ